MGVCFIIDGLDEYQPQQKKEFVISDLLHKTYLPLSMVIVSSHPMATISLKQEAPITKKLDLVGFSEQNVLE